MKKKVLIETMSDFFSSSAGQKILSEAISKALQEEGVIGVLYETFNKALIREMQFVKMKDDNTGQPLKSPKYKVENVNVVDQLVLWLSGTEGAIRGLQNDVAKRFENSDRIYRLLENIADNSNLANLPDKSSKKLLLSE